MSPAPRRTSRDAIVAAARELLEEGGLEAVSMASVAERVGVRPPSLYKHVTDRGALVAAMGDEVASELGGELRAAIRDAGPGVATRLRSVAAAYRAFAIRWPRSAALLFAGVTVDGTPSPAALAAGAAPLLEVTRELVGERHALPAARVLTAFTHGFTSMEAAGAFRLGGDVAEAFELGVEALLAGLPAAVADSGAR